ncbi:MAG: ABC transporter permease [Candidatus Cloacimonetes bacterium]|nr:ABC transporter permease [Candidatus Cloacimonadota bacterium]
MLRNYFVIAFRNIWKNRLNSFINILGLVLGLTCSLLILFFIRSELSYEKHFPRYEQIYRVTNENLEEAGKHWAVISPLHGQAIAESVPEVESVVRMVYTYKQFISSEYDNGNIVRFQENNGYFADSGIFDMFDLKMLSGDPNTALKAANSIVLTESFARKYFGNVNPLGKYLKNESQNIDLEVTGIIPDLPQNTHLRFDHLISMETFYNRMKNNGAEDWLQSKGWAYFSTYVLLKENTVFANASHNLDIFADNFYQEWFAGSEEKVSDYIKLHFQPISDIHLHSHLEQEMGPNSDITYVKVFGFAAILILLLAGVNFINLSTARAFNRMREVGVRKVLGANKADLTAQFLVESLLIALISGIAAVAMIEMILPLYNSITGINFAGTAFLRANNLLLIFAVVLIFGLASGIYPSVFMSLFNISTALNNKRTKNSTTTVIRHCLIIFQFIISTVMIFSTFIIFQQLRYFNHKELGFNKENLIAVQLYGDLRQEAINNTQTLKDYLVSHSGISGVTLCSNIPGERLSVEDLRLDAIPEDAEQPPIRYIRVDHDYIETMGLQIVDGKSFKNWTSENPAFILNETALQATGIEGPLGKMASNFRGTEAEIVGVVKDFHFASLHNRIEPLVIELNPAWSSNMIVRASNNDIAGVLNIIKDKFQEISPGSVFNFSFVDEKLEELYKNEQRMNTIFQLFTILAIVISCLGLFGLSIYYSELRIKEIGIRKALGAGSFHIVRLLTAKFFLWIALADLIALPLAWYAMHLWLQNFAFKISITALVFLISIAFSLIIMLISVSYHSLKAATRNPIKALKYE